MPDTPSAPAPPPAEMLRLYADITPETFGPDVLSGFLPVALDREWATIFFGGREDEIVELVPASRLAAAEAERDRLAARWEALIAHARARRDHYAGKAEEARASSDPAAMAVGFAAVAFVSAYNDMLSAAGSAGGGAAPEGGGS